MMLTKIHAARYELRAVDGRPMGAAVYTVSGVGGWRYETSKGAQMKRGLVTAGAALALAETLGILKRPVVPWATLIAQADAAFADNNKKAARA